MATLPDFAVDLDANMGKKNAREYRKTAGLLQSRRERDGKVLEEERRGYTVEDLVAYLVDEYRLREKWLEEDRTIYGGGLNAREIFLEHVVDRLHVGRVTMNGILRSFITGDFANLYRALTLYVRCCYAGDIDRELSRGRGYAYGSGTDHGVYFDEVLACFALMRPDYAKRFFPRELGLVRRSHVTLNRAGSLIAALLHDDAEWRDKSLRDAGKYLQGKRQVGERAVVGYLVALCEGDADAMSNNLQMVMDNYRKSGWLVMGDACRIPLYALYFMAKLYSDDAVFSRVRRPSGPGWWDEYADLCLQDPLPVALAEPYIVFPEPLGFVNHAIGAIDREPLPGRIVNSLDVPQSN